MRDFFGTTFGPTEIGIIQGALDAWRQSNGLSRSDPDLELAGAIIINLFREGHVTVSALMDAAGRHKGLRDLADHSR